MKSIFLLFLSTLLLSSCATPTQMMLDAEVRRLCAIDGGVVIHEPMKITRAQARFLPLANGLPAVTDEATAEQHAPAFSKLISNTLLFDKGGAKIGRTERQVIRRSDGRILATKISYMRTGGDLPSPAFPSSYWCPTLEQLSADTSKIFILYEGSEK